VERTAGRVADPNGRRTTTIDEASSAPDHRRTEPRRTTNRIRVAGPTRVDVHHNYYTR
jgi:hypothetical protein